MKVHITVENHRPTGKDAVDLRDLKDTLEDFASHLECNGPGEYLAVRREVRDIWGNVVGTVEVER